MKVDSSKIRNLLNQPSWNGRCVVVLSGGQDSSTCLALAKKLYKEVTCVTFDYGQRNSAELAQAKAMASEFGVSTTEINVTQLFAQIAESSLVGAKGNVNDAHPFGKGLPASFVPNRNAMFFTAVHAYAQKIGATTIFSGICASDEEGYPDTTSQFQSKMEKALNEGSRADIHFVAPLLNLNKAETFLLAYELGKLATIIERSHTCYNNNRTMLHAWGYGCNDCNGCKLRAEGFEHFRKYINETEGKEL